jgi:PAS domain-containing protein
MDPLDIVSGSADAAFATDEQGRIVIWNKAAEKLRLSAARVLGKPCHETLCGHDVFGNRFCDEACALAHMVRREGAVPPFRDGNPEGVGETFSASFTIFMVPGIATPLSHP